MLSGLLLAASFPPLHLLVPPFIGLVPLVVFLSECPETGEGRRRALRSGMVFGAVYFGVMLHWVPLAMARMSLPAAGAAFGLVLSVAAGLGALFAWWVHGGLRGGLHLALVVPVAWTAGEWLRAHLPGGLAFPWLGLGMSLTSHPELAGAAELVGSRGLSFWMAVVNGLIASAIVGARAGRRWMRWGVGALVVTFLPMGWGVWRASTLDTRPAGRVALVQPATPRLGSDAARTYPAGLDSLLGGLNASEAFDLAVLPEGAIWGLIARGEPGGDPLPSLRRRAQALDVPILFGATGIDSPLDDAVGAYNSAFLMRPNGLEPERQDKLHLVLGVERALFGASWSGRQPPGASGAGPLRPGDGLELFEVGGHAYGVLICFDSAFPETSRALRLQGADVLVNITNDAWFHGPEGSGETTAFRQHPAHAVMRAVEHRVGVVRVGNTGVSMVVDPSGEVTSVLPPRRAAFGVATVRTTDRLTLYARFGDVMGFGAAIAAVLITLGSLVRDRRTGGPIRPS